MSSVKIDSITKSGGRGVSSLYYILRLSDGTSLKLSSEIISQESIHIGQILNETERNKILYLQTVWTVREKALQLLSRRAHSRGEIENKLKLRGFPREIILSVIDNLEVEGYLNDNEFALLFVRSRLLLKPSGRRLMAYELSKRKVAPRIIQEVLDKVYYNLDESQLAYQLLKKRAETYTRFGGKELKDKVFRYLKSRGFNYEHIKEALKMYCAEFPCDNIE